MTSPHPRRRTARRGALALAVCSAALVGPTLPAIAQTAPAPPTPEERAAALARPSVVYLETHWSGYVFDEDGIIFNDGQPYEFASRCTGFVVDPTGYIATAGHCVDPAIEFGSGETLIAAAVQEAIALETYNTNDPAELFAFGAANWRIEGATAGAPADRQVFAQRGTATGGRTDGEALPARVVDFRPLEQGDVALLKVERTDLPAIEVGDGADVSIGTSVLSIGYPGSTDEVTDASFEPTNKDGKVNAEKTVGTVSFLEMSAALSGGMSGGPTVGLDGQVVGVNSWSPTSEAQAFNFISPSSHLMELMSRNGVNNALGPMDVAYREGLEHMWAGRYSDAIAQFDRVISIVPSHQQAQEYRQEAAQARETFGDVQPAAAAGGGGDEGGLPIVAILAAVAGVAVVGGLGAFLGLRGKGGKGSPAVAGGPTPSGWPQQAGYAAAPQSPGYPAAAPQPPLPQAPLPQAPLPQAQHSQAPLPQAPLPQAPVAQAPPAPSVGIPVQAPAPAPESRDLTRAAASREARQTRVAPPAAAAPQAAAFCSRCGTQRTPGAKFCGTCGETLH